MPALQKNIVIEQGVGFRLRGTYKQDGVLVDLAGYAGHAQGRGGLKNELIFSVSTTDGEIVFGPDLGKFEVTVPAAKTALTTPAEGVWDFFIVSPAGEPIKLLTGTLRKIPRVSTWV